jgi:hypothetical protein
MQDEIKLLRLGAWLQLIAVVIGGPLLVIVVNTVSPQPVWSDIYNFSSHYSFLQSLPYWAGFILIIGNILFVVSAGRFPAVRKTSLYPLALIAITVYSALIAFNYTIQVAYIPATVRSPAAGVEIFSMANANSISWALEMFGYAILGIAVWLVAPAFKGNIRRNIIRWLLIVDAIVSILGVVLEVVFIGKMLNEGALVGYYFWNALVALIAILVLYEYRHSETA